LGDKGKLEVTEVGEDEDVEEKEEEKEEEKKEGMSKRKDDECE